jgi:hypothetical protein
LVGGDKCRHLATRTVDQERRVTNTPDVERDAVLEDKPAKSAG